MAAGGFVSRAFESMLKECSGKKYPDLQKAIQTYIEKTDQTVVSISLGALVHLIEVGGHQFSESDWDTLLKSIRDASYTTQPLELLNALSFEKPKSPRVLVADSEVVTGDVADNHLFNNGDGGNPLASPNSAHGIGGNPNALVLENHSQESGSQSSLDGSEGLPSPSGRTHKPAEAAGLQRSQTFGQMIMENLFLRSLTSKSKAHASDTFVPSSPTKVPDAVEPETKDEEESPLMAVIRGKCITQLLLLGAIDSIQKKYWSKLRAPQKIAIMDVLLSILEFAASYNLYPNLRMRMHRIPVERPPLNLLCQELAGTSIYLDVLQKTTSGLHDKEEQLLQSNVSEATDITLVQNGSSITSDAARDEKLEGLAEEKLVSFYEQVLKEASDLQSSVGETTNMDVHRVLELRSPITVKVLKGMCFMNNQIFKRHLRYFYPLLTKLVCYDQMDIRGALADLFRLQLKALLPWYCQ